MTSQPLSTEEMLDTIACEIDKRPNEAPSFNDLQPFVRGMRREGGALVVLFDSARADDVEALADAERQCCSTLGFDVMREPELALRITAAPAQLDIFEQFLIPNGGR